MNFKVQSELRNRVDALEATSAGRSDPHNKKRPRTNYDDLNDSISTNIMESAIARQSEVFMQLFNKLETRQAEMATAIDHIYQNTSTTPSVRFAPNDMAPTSLPHLHVLIHVIFGANQAATISYAMALAKSTTSPESIRNLFILGTPEECANGVANLRRDTLCAESRIKSIKDRGQNNMTIKFANAIRQ